MSYVIEKNIPLPPLGGLKGILLEMEIGDSVFISGGEEAGRKAESARTNARHTDKSKKWSLRKAIGGYRVWRVS